MREKYINFNDKSVPIGKRKVAYIKWAVSRGDAIGNRKKTSQQEIRL